MNNNCIGVFDSGLGGLTTVKKIMEELPNENIIYFGDTSRLPYGTRSDETIVKYVRSDIKFLQSFNVKTIVIACGTASSVALPIVRKEIDTPIIGVVGATVNASIAATKNKKIGIIGTSGTINSGSYEKLINEIDPEINTYSQSCPLFVSLVENGHFNTKVTKLVIEEYLSDIKSEGVDTLILGCTHYPLLKIAINEFMGGNVKLIDSGAETAKYLKTYFAENQLHSNKIDENQYQYYVSDNIDGFIKLGGTFLQREINGQVRKIDIEKY